MKQLGLETGQSVEMGTIHAGDFMVGIFSFYLSRNKLFGVITLLFFIENNSI